MVLPLVPWPASVSLADPVAPGAAYSVIEPGEEAPSPSLAEAAERVETLETDPAIHPEGYRLTTTPDAIRIVSSTPAGEFYARQTLAQLEAAGPLPEVDIQDEPRFAHRGLMLDVARHFHSVETVEAVIRHAAALKLNRLHLHLSDDQGWRLQLRSHPELTERGSGTAVDGDPGGFYTRDDWQRILDAAAAHHMTVIPEIDLPGHTHAIGLSHPELVADPVPSPYLDGPLPSKEQPYTGTAVGFSSLRADAPGLETFLREVLGEIAELTPGAYLHVGGDEALGTDPADYRTMVELATRLVAETGKTPITWHEAGAAALPAGAVGQYWGYRAPAHDGDDAASGGADRVRAIVANGGRVILSPADAIYLDMKPTEDSPLGLTWANGPTSLERSYDWDPATVIPDLPEEAILGVEACLWSETIRTLDDIETMIFPRIGSAAEAAWSRPAGTPEREFPSFSARMPG